MSVAERDSETRTRTRQPKRYKAVFLNDDFTPQNFVTAVLMKFFGLGEDDAEALMMQIHRDGRGTTGDYTYEVAESKTTQAMDAAKAHEFPFACHPEEK